MNARASKCLTNDTKIVYFLNEKKIGTWEELPAGGRRYFYAVKGQRGWSARYLKEVDSLEQTIRFYQEIYNEQNRLVEVHEKYPVDHGHIKIQGDKS